MKRVIALSLLLLAGCSTIKPIVSGCYPPDDLPYPATIETIPPGPRTLTEVFPLFLRERTTHATLVDQYNSLQNHIREQCQ